MIRTQTEVPTIAYSETDAGGLIATRLLIGAFEAGFYPTSIVYLGYFYSPFDLARRIALFFGQYAIASAFSGALCK